MPKHFVYMVFCADGTIYTGYTTDPARRVREHNSVTGAKYTRSRGPVALAYVEELPSRPAALRRELRVKKMKRSGKLLLCRKYLGSQKHSQR